MDALRGLATDAGTFLSRTRQYTEEKLGSAEKTELDAHFENLQQRADRTKSWTEKIVGRTEAVLQPNPNLRVEDYFNSKLDRRPKERENNYELLGIAMIESGNDLGPGTQYGAALVKCGTTQKKLGQLEKDLVNTSITNYMAPLRNFLDTDMKTINKEKKILESKRLDLDACKSKVRKAKSTENQKAPNNEDMVYNAEADLRLAQNEFDRQYEITKLLLEGVGSAHSNHLRCLQDFIEAQQNFFSQSQAALADLQKQLGNLPGSGPIRPPPPNLDGSVPSAKPYITGNGQMPVGNSMTRNAKVLYDYDAADSSELSLLADELITVWSAPGLDSDWMIGQRGSQTGKVPVTYLELM
ncbi:endophilin-B1-like isoform X2 [Anneissia japonica]|uniref:endophilin-B1-like isoform X2 n=1 Tax=Anneissia japonica TaxID=1529436 RepID=UPI001425A714|nr:endophilin-B1-like isoform X2 [Anneissia japonica]